MPKQTKKPPFDFELITEALRYYLSALHPSYSKRAKIQETIKDIEAKYPVKENEIVTKKHGFAKPNKRYHFIKGDEE